tara:strand:- start:334 stop:453 length:120 start_codon:yes stop_codon:yes gene_type:complete
MVVVPNQDSYLEHSVAFLNICEENDAVKNSGVEIFETSE